MAKKELDRGNLCLQHNIVDLFTGISTIQTDKAFTVDGCAHIDTHTKGVTKQLLAGSWQTWRLSTNLIETTKWLFFSSYLEAGSLMSRFANRNILDNYILRQCKMNIQNRHFCKWCHVRCQIVWDQDFNLILYLNSCFYLVKYWKKWRPLYH